MRPRTKGVTSCAPDYGVKGAFITAQEVAAAMRAAFLLLAGLLLTAGLASAEDFVINPQGGDAVASVLAVTTDGQAYCASTQCAAATLDGDAYCYGPYCASFAADGTAYCQALVCPAVSIFGDSTAIGRHANTYANAVVAFSVFGDAHSDRTRTNQNDVAISGTGDASSDTVAISVTGHASDNGGASGNAIVLSGCDNVDALCMDPA